MCLESGDENLTDSLCERGLTDRSKVKFIQKAKL